MCDVLLFLFYSGYQFLFRHDFFVLVYVIFCRCFLKDKRERERVTRAKEEKNKRQERNEDLKNARRDPGARQQRGYFFVQITRPSAILVIQGRRALPAAITASSLHTVG